MISGDGTGNLRGTIPFKRWLLDDFDHASTSRDLLSQPGFWAVLLVSGHENFPSSDFDADGIIGPSATGELPTPGVDQSIDLGVSDTGLLFDGNISVVFMEVVREFDAAFGSIEQQTVAHEIGHTAGGGLWHQDAGLLKASASEYISETSFLSHVLATFRSVTTW